MKYHQNTVRNWYKRYKSEGHYLAKKVGGKKGRVTPQDIASYIETNPNFILSDMGKHFEMSAAGAHYWLKKLGYSYKKKDFTYLEASEEKRKNYEQEIESIPTEKLVYTDESGIDLTICRDRGWGKKGKTLPAKKSGKYYQRTNIIAGYVNNKSIAPMVFNGACNTEVFNSWVEHFLIKELEPGQFVVMDNASFHKSQKTKELIESVGCKVIFLPPYFSRLKSYREILGEYEAMDQV